TPPMRLSTDHDPLFRFHRWLANLRILEVEEIKSVPYAPMLHPFIERLIGTIRREYLDQAFFRNSVDLHRKLGQVCAYYDGARVHRSLNGVTPIERAGRLSPPRADFAEYQWTRHCRGLFQTPVAP
ncbi:MAG: integrase core domain-containing protein, partial [Gammaproteobacteria bacterium]|nr:integrase core domain-containing protein [Gammaproteobacteria bacterium]